jgi:hypothetical protein
VQIADIRLFDCEAVYGVSVIIANRWNIDTQSSSLFFPLSLSSNVYVKFGVSNNKAVNLLSVNYRGHWTIQLAGAHCSGPQQQR